MFVILDETNTAHCTFTNPYTGNSQTILTLDDDRSIFVARVQYAYSQGIHHSQVACLIQRPIKRLAA